jgi:hypothetical protein
MSIAASAWAWAQEIPLKPKFALIKLADQTDERTGRVCYGRTDLDYLAAKCSMPRRSLTRCIAALIANRYIIRESGKGKGACSQYWLCLSREVATSIDEFVWSAADETQEAEPESDDATAGDEPQDIEGGGPNWPTPPEDKTAENGPPGGPTNGLPGGPILGPQESTKELKNDGARASAETRGFSKEQQDLERAGMAKKVAASKPARYFVVEGSRAWDAWLVEMRRRTRMPGWHLTTWATFKGKQRCGWYFPSLFPPPDKPAAPPGNLSAEDAREFGMV